ncbi:MAG: M15 family metallopeptidase, partial [Ruthenibacterium sp.]
LGLAADIVALDDQLLDEKQAETPEQVWLMEHCAEYGFILRYPEGKEAITGVTYEPWHYRYVGKEAAQYITQQGLTLEEYLQDSNGTK